MIGIVWAFVAIPTFRSVLGIALVLATLAIVAFIVIADDDAGKTHKQKLAEETEKHLLDEQHAARRQELWSVIAPSLVEISDPALTDRHLTMIPSDRLNGNNID